MISPIGWIIIWIGIAFDILGTIGLVGIMIGIFLLRGFTPMGVKALICGVFLLLTSPVAAHALMKGSLHFGTKMWKGTVVDEYGKDKLKGEQIEKEDK